MWYQQHSHIWDNMRRSKQTKTKLMFGWRGESAVRQRAVQANQPALSSHVTAPGYKYQPAPSSTPSSEHSQLQNRGATFRTRIKMNVWHIDALGDRVVGQPSSPSDLRTILYYGESCGTAQCNENWHKRNWFSWRRHIDSVLNDVYWNTITCGLGGRPDPGGAKIYLNKIGSFGSKKPYLTYL